MDPLSDRAVELALEHWGIRAVVAAPLPGERDRNVRLGTADGQSYVLKIAAADETPDVLDLQHTALARLAAQDLPYRFPRPLPTADGSTVVAVPESALGAALVGREDAIMAALFSPARSATEREGGGGGEGEGAGGAGADGAAVRLVRVLEWVPGRPLSKTRPTTPALLQDVGAMLASVDRALAGLTHPAVDRELYWNLTGGRALVERRIEEVGDVAHRALVARHLRHFDEHAGPRLAELRTGPIHGDANDWNVLVGGPADRFEPRTATGLVDFGDMVTGWLVGEAAIAGAYAMLGRAHPIEALGAVARGYHAVLPLREAEVDLLYPLAVLRLCMSVVLAAKQRRERPDNEYLSVTEAPAWAALETLNAVHPRLAAYTLRDACGLEPCPAGGRVSTWLRENGGGSAPVLDPDPRTAASVVIDLSVDAEGLERLRGRDDDAAAWTRVIGDRMRDAGASIAVGRWNEARRWYASYLFRVETDEGPDWRTVHVGIDLFAPAGTVVRAPLDGSVAAVRDNAGHLDYGPTLVLRHEPGGGDVVFHTLYGHLAPEVLTSLTPGQEVRAGQAVAAVGAPPGNGGWAPHLHFQVIADLLDRDGDFPGVARPSERALWCSICPDPNLLLRIPHVEPAREPDDAALAERRKASLGPSLSLSYHRPIHVVRGSMQHLYDADGRAYLDCVNNVAHVGHSHPRVVEAMARQAAVLNTNTRYLHGKILEYAERLTALLPEPLSVVYLVCSGSEANELALRIARAHTRRRDVVVLGGAYHGNTSSLVEMSPYKFEGPGGFPRPAHVHVAAMPDPYRGVFRGDGAGSRYAADVGRALAEAAAGDPGEAGVRAGAAAFFHESLLSCGGQVPLPRGYLRDAYARVRDAGGVCVADEVQVGFGRVGDAFWGFELQEVVPDVVTLGKPIGNGHPLGAVVTTPALAASFANGMEYFNTFGGNPVSCAAGLAVLDVIADEDLQQHARATGAHLSTGLRELMRRHVIIGDVRGPGLFVGVELVLDREGREPAPRHAAHLVQRMRDHGVLMSTDGPDHNVLKIKPPLPFDSADADRVVETMDRILDEDAFRL